MPLSNPIPAIAFSPGARASSPASTLSHAHPATPSANTPFNEQQTISNEQSSALALFLQVLHIAMVVVSAITKRMDSDLHCLTLLQGCEAINCLYSIIRIQLTIDRHPERITPAELRRLAKASRYINRLARQKLDFSPFTTTDDPPSTDNEQQATDNEQQTTDNKQQATSATPSANPQSSSPSSALRAPRLTVLRSTPVCHSPGATLACTCQSLCRLLKLLPDLSYDPSGTVATLDLANPDSFSLNLGARTPSSASTLTPADPIASQQDAVSRVRQPCCRFSSPTTTQSSSVPTASAPT